MVDMRYDCPMATSTKARTENLKSDEIGSLHDLLIAEKQRLERLLQRVEEVLSRRQRTREAAEPGAHLPGPPRSSPLDTVENLIAATCDLRVPGGNLSALRIAKLYGISLN